MAMLTSQPTDMPRRTSPTTSRHARTGWPTVVCPARVLERCLPRATGRYPDYPAGTPGEGWASLTTVTEPVDLTTASEVVDGRPSRESPTANCRCLDVDTWAMIIMCRSTWTAMSSSASRPKKLHSRI
jgi:hypothetical protein